MREGRGEEETEEGKEEIERLGGERGGLRVKVKLGLTASLTHIYSIALKIQSVPKQPPPPHTHTQTHTQTYPNTHKTTHKGTYPLRIVERDVLKSKLLKVEGVQLSMRDSYVSVSVCICICM